MYKRQTHYIVNVLRLKRGAEINFFNKNGEWKSEIIYLEKNRVEVKFLKKIKQPTSSSKINLAICLVKKIPMDIILQKATELGVGKIIPLIGLRFIYPAKIGIFFILVNSKVIHEIFFC